MIDTLKNLKKENFLIFIIIFFTILFPITYLVGNSVINTLVFILSLSLIAHNLIKKDLNKFNNIIFIFLFCLWSTFVINLFFSQNFDLSLNRVLKFFFIIFFIFAIKFSINYKNNYYEHLIFKLWTFIFLIVFFDLIFEYHFGYNITGNVSFMPSRLTSFLKDELVIGYYFIGFALFAYVTLEEKIDNKLISFLILMCLIILSFLIGERANFIKFFIACFTFLMVASEINIKKKLFSLAVVVSIIFFIIQSNAIYKSRFIYQMPNIFSLNETKNFYFNSTYGSHYNTAINVFKNNLLFGVGIKNYREQSIKKIYIDKNKDFKFKIIGTHPHQLHFEILAETGLFGYISFFSFIIYSLVISIKTFVKNRNKYQLSAILFIVVSIIPVLPSGSIFSTYTSILFWLNYAIMISYNRK